jgi:hypothetical protein
MIRQCFLCKTDVEVMFSTPWALPGLPTTEIGFSVCPSCGSACQSPSVSFDDMMKFYQSVAVYTNPGRGEQPSDAKVRDLDEQIQFIKRGMGDLPQSVLQIGSSDGYTLSRFEKAGIPEVLGVEPGEASVAIAKRLYGIDCLLSCAEDFETNKPYELILLTHVLEHLFDPQMVLKKCRGIQGSLPEGFIYVEVPLLAHVDSLCPGFFSFEHINYFTRGNLVNSLRDAGYYPVSLVEHFTSNLSPVIGILASTVPQGHMPAANSEAEQNRARLQKYRAKETAYWQGCLDQLASHLVKAERIILWGAGIHTSQLVANTDLMTRYGVNGLVDTSSLKWGIRQGDWVCADPSAFDWQDGDTVIISSYASEDEIYCALGWLRDRGIETLRLHNVGDVKAH